MYLDHVSFIYFISIFEQLGSLPEHILVSAIAKSFLTLHLITRQRISWHLSEKYHPFRFKHNGNMSEERTLKGEGIIF